MIQSHWPWALGVVFLPATNGCSGKKGSGSFKAQRRKMKLDSLGQFKQKKIMEDIKKQLDWWTVLKDEHFKRNDIRVLIER